MVEKRIIMPDTLDKDSHELSEETTDWENDDLLPVIVSNKVLNVSENSHISHQHINSFNFLKLSASFDLTKTTLGITSVNSGDGKTKTAANMATSLALGYQRKTLLIDFNFLNPSLHEVFETSQHPGLADTLEKKSIRISPTAVENLYLMTAGNCSEIKTGIKHTLVLRQVLKSLKEAFEFIVVDLPAILPLKEFPIHFINEIDGLINVIDVKKTKKTDYNKAIKYIDENRFIGYVFNNVDE
jgi:Mrp family chromosome partitioning ATPase